ncbi:MAG TPA: hypothetical protein VF796_22250, partial [Humisphaera sp.]
MITARQIDRLFHGKDFSRLLHDLTSHRADALVRWDARASRHTLAAAMSAIRLDELNFAAHPLSGKMIQVVLAAQEADGGWGDPVTTALCLRALLAGRGDGVAVERGLSYLANLQQEGGSFPAGPFRRMPADAHATAAVVYLLAEHTPAWAVVDLGGAADWVDAHPDEQDVATRVVARHALTR